ncbi:hypothetical protein BURMUCGD2M_5141 [Burkholderia multivorans CGD2M]|nr:hypothetical protein BURMUCGD2M_5141 [Burkholderia multivorans CGD2M]
MRIACCDAGRRGPSCRPAAGASLDHAEKATRSTGRRCRD